MERTHFLGEEVDVGLVAAGRSVEEFDKGQGLRRRRNGDDERGHGRAAHIHESPFSQQDHPFAIRPDHVIHLRAHLLPRQVRRPQTILFSSSFRENL